MAEEQGETPATEEQVLELTEEVQASEESEVQTEEAGSDDEEVVVSFGDEAAPASEEAPEWVRDLRKRNRELERELAEAKKAQAPTVPEVGDKPTLESCDYDEDRFETEFNSYLDRKSKAEAAKSEAQKAQDAVRERYQAKVETYGNQKQTLGVKDFDEAEAEVLGALNPAQQSILIHGAENKAQLVYALGKHPEKLRALASIADPIEFAFAAAKLEGQAKMERRRPATTPESQVSGSGQLGQPKTALDDKQSNEEWMKRRREQVRKR
jgi:hypothetical protein